MFPYVRIYRFEKGNERRKPQRSDTGRIGVRKNDGRKNLSSSWPTSLIYRRITEHQDGTYTEYVGRTTDSNETDLRGENDL